MTPSHEALARRVVACPGWRWMEGMLSLCGLRILDDGADDVVGWRHGATRDGGGWYDGTATGLLPDLSDPATRGCLLELVRKAAGEVTLHARPYDNAWGIECVESGDDWQWLRNDGTWGYGSAPVIEEPTESEALVAALEAAGRKG